MKYFYFGGEPPKMKGNRFNLPINRLFSWAFIAALCLIGQIGFAQQTITHSTSQTLLSVHGVACPTGPNSFMRVFDLSNDFGITDDFAVSEAQFGVESLGAHTSVDVTVNIYSTAGTFPAGFPGNATLQAVATTTVTLADEMQVVSVPINGVIPFGEKLILEVTTPQMFYPGANDAGETDFSYIMGSFCGITEPSTYASLDPDFSDVHLVMNVIGDYLTACTGIPNGGTASTSLANGGTGTSYDVFVSGHTVADDMSYQWEADFGSGWQDQGTASSTYAPYNATAQMPLGSTEQWRLKSTCTASGETSYSTIATFDVQIIYCMPTISTTIEPITRVIFSDIDNSSSSSSTDAYEDFTAIEGNVSQGVSYMFTEEGYTGGSYTNLFTVWIDWNQNGTFESSEMYEIGSINNSSGTDGVQATSSIYVPEGIPSGATTMRVIKNFSSSPTDPCGSYGYGQAEDYTILVGPPPSCLSPTNLASNNITSSSVDIQWTANNSETDWNVSWGAPGYTPGDVDEVGSATGVTTNPYQITGLNGTTSYDIYVQADCGGGDESFWVGPLTVTTLCDPFVAPFFEDFNAGALPNCWDNLSSDPSTSADNFWKFTGTPGYGASSNGKTAGTYAWVDGSSPFSDSIMLITPLIDISALTVPALSFEWFGNNTDNPGDHNPFVVSVHDGTQWHFIDSLDGDSPEWRERLYDLSPYAGNIIQVRFMVNNALLGSSLAYYQDILLDDVRIDEMPTCPKPLDLQVDAATFSSVDISWTAGGTEAAWNISWGAPGYTPGDVDEVGTDNVTSPSYQITGLTGQTDYDIYVQADCGGGDESYWIGPLTVTTLCDVFVAPFHEDFEASSFPNCWENLSNLTSTSANNFWKFSGTPGNGASSNGKPGGSYAWVDRSTPTPDSTMLITPLIDISALTVPALSFEWFSNNTNNPGDNNPLIIEVHDGTTWNYIDTLKGDSPDWQERFYDLSAYIGNDIRVRFMVNQAILGSNAFYNDILLDEVRVDEMPTCPKPIELDLVTISNQTADIEWTPGFAETAWNISWGTPGYTPGDVDEIGTASATTSSYQITGLTAETYYDIYVQADCGSGDESMWVGPLTIYTGYCVPTSTGNTTRYIDGVVTQGALMNINNTGTGLSPDAYGDYTGTDTLRVYPGQEISVEFTHPSSTYHYKIWVDWDSDLNFDGPNDLIYATTSYQSSPHLVDITVPALTPEGVYRMRVRNSYTTLGGPCGNNASSETEDYILHVVAPPSCLPVSDIVTTSATFQTSTITWTANNSETSWNISWGNPGYTPGDGDELGTDVSTSTTYQITGLTGDTHYDVYVQADCGGGDESMWAGPYTIFTGYCEVSTTSTADYLSSVVSEDALTDISYSATTQPAGSYANETAQLFRAFPGQTFDMKTSYVGGGGSNGVNIWIDWDQDLDFDPVTELVASQASSSSDKTFSIDVPAGTAPGTYRMRVRGQFGSSANPPACGSVSFGSTIDFNLVVIECTTTPGIDGYAEVCRAEGTIELNDVATLSSTEGAWEFTSNPSVLNGSVLNVSSLPAGSYDVLYVIDFPGCIEDTTVATIDVFGPSSAGTGGIISVCAGAPINLYSALSGNVDMGGDWYDYNGNLLGTSQPTAPNLGASYNYTYITSNGVCDADTAFVEVVVDASPDCTSNIQEEMAVNLSVYPNPTTDVLHIVNPTNIAALKVEVLDMNGRIVLVENSALKNTTEATISLGNLNTGVYTLRVYNEEGQKIFKVVKR